ncbi:ABC transporter ATP-binding protein [Streptococcus moroccensis]|uniref:Energy-coupling factor transport system ATP-binding protein n=1 Tax=Streptococcus moroccensis TaxID=1451356 RepID=A0ABT9YNI4_9STRE|nr:ABC transporter ATP-binding protein [Streptococcus moroccensis]MDQ0221547.1 energy-coupling factor transport system ATP-binding protein [Streptococcus moroccensis]
MKKKIIEFKNLTFQYDAQAEPTLNQLDMTIYEGEKVLIAGPSGSGKSTIGQLLNGIIPHIYKGELSGELLLAGKPAFESSIYDKSQIVSTVLQDTDGQFIGLSVAEDMAFALENDQVPQNEMQKQIAKWAQQLELSDLLDHRPQDLSGGQKQRVSLAGVLIDESPILLFDEPLANLDPQAGRDTIALIQRLQESTKATTLIIEHRLEEVLALQLDRVILIDDGKIVFNGAPQSLLATTLLTEHGIREPLYLSVLRDLGYDLTSDKPLDQLSQLDLTAVTIPQLPQSTVPQNNSKEPLLTVRNLTFGYTEQPILKGITLDLHAGERLAIVGKNGAGKSTLAKVLCQFVEAEGEFLWEGQSITGDSIKERAERIGYVLQNPNQMISQTMIYDEVALGLRLRGVEESEIERRVHDVLNICGLYAMRKWPISALSYGQKKRVTIASIMVLGAKVLLLDEPTAGQDQAHYKEMMRFLDQLAQMGHTIVMITHDMQLMLEHSDRCVVLVDGQIKADQSPIEVLSNLNLVRQSHLRETSIFTLAQRLGVDPVGLSYVYKERNQSHGL